MKKSFLLFSAMSVFGLVNAQNMNKAVIKDVNGMQSRIDRNQAVLAPQKLISTPNAKMASTINLGTSFNIFSILGDRQNQVVYNPDINTVAFVHRQNDGGPGGAQASGIISFDYSTDGGANWTINKFQTTPTGGGSAWDGNRYPNMGIYNPTSNTDTSNAYFVQAGPGLEVLPSHNDRGWATTWRSSFMIDGSNLDETYDTNTFSTAGDPNEWGTAGLYVTSQGTAWYVSTNSNNSGTATQNPNGLLDTTDNYSKYFIVRGDFNSTNNNFDWTVVDTITPAWNITDNNGTPYNMSGLPNMAWSTDGNTGYIVIMGSWGPNTMMRPYVLKTTDAGMNWNLVNDFDFSTLPELQCMINPPIGMTSTQIRPFFGSYDVVVDNNDELRIFCEISSGFSSHPDSLLFTFAARQFGHLYEATTNGTGWDVTYIDSIYVDDHQWDATNTLDHFVRPQASRSQDGSKLFYTWLTSDPFLSGTREFPEISSTGHDVATDMWTPITNLSTGNASQYVAGYATMAVDVIQNGSEKNYELPIVYATAVGGGALADGLVGPQWTYLRGAGFDNSEFTRTAMNCPTSIDELTLSENSVSVYPNPTNGILEIRLTDVNEFNYTIIDVLGNVVASNDVTGNNVSLDLTNNARGVYFISLNTDKGSITKKVMLTK